MNGELFLKTRIRFSPSHYDALSLLDATELLATQFHPQNLSISVVGDIELEGNAVTKHMKWISRLLSRLADVKMNLETYVGTIMPPAEVPAFCLKRDMLRQATSLAVNHSGNARSCMKESGHILTHCLFAYRWVLHVSHDRGIRKSVCFYLCFGYKSMG